MARDVELEFRTYPDGPYSSPYYMSYGDTRSLDTKSRI